MKKVKKIFRSWKRKLNRTSSNIEDMFDEDEELGMFELFPDEICIEIFTFLPVEDLCQNIALVNKRFGSLYRLGIHTVKIGGAMRKLPEDSLIKVIRKFEKLEKLVICNNGSLSDYQITNSGLIQLAHKYIYHTADFFSCREYNFMLPTFGSYEDMLETLSANISGPSDNDYEDFYYRHCKKKYDIESDSDVNTIQSIISFSSGPSEGSEGSYMSERISSKKSGSGRRNRENLRKRASLRMSVESFGSVVSQHMKRIVKEKKVKKKKKGDDSNNNNNNNNETNEDLQKLVNLRKESQKEEGGRKKKKEEEEEIEGEGEDESSEEEEEEEEEDDDDDDEKGIAFAVKDEEREKKKIEEPNYGLSTLKYLDLTGCNLLTDFGAKYLTYICRDVEHLCLRGCMKLTDKAMEYFEKFNKIQSINVAGLSRISDRSMEILSTKPLRKVDLTFVRRLTDVGLTALSQCGETLEDLNLQCCSLITSQGLDALLSKCHKLKKLNLTGCNMIELCKLNQKDGDRSVPELQHLNLLGCTKLCDECIKTLYGSMRCHKLVSLSIAYSDFISDSGIKEIVNHSRKKMTELIIKKCPKITNAGVMEIVKKMKRLEVFDLSQCNYNTNIFKKLKNIKQLGKLVLVRSPCLNDPTLRVLARIRSLTVLDLSNNDNVSYEGLYKYCSSHYTPIMDRKSKKKWEEIYRKDHSTLKEVILIRVPLNQTQRKNLVKFFPEISFVFFREYRNNIITST